MEDFEKAKDKVLMGSERKSMVINEKDRKITAYHEAGHAIVGRSLAGLDPIHKVTIIPRGMALGITQTLPEDDQLNLSKSKATNMIAFLFGGRAAEEIIFTDYTTGAGNDIERATELARRMVCEWGMSEKLGPLSYEKREGPVFLGMQSAQSRDYSDSKAEEIDAEVYRLVSEGRQMAMDILNKNMTTLHNMAALLLEHETIDSDDVNALVRGETLVQVKHSRGVKKEQQERDRLASQAEDRNKIELKKKTDGNDPIGNTGPVTA
jgi:cell division protease FtsH